MADSLIQTAQLGDELPITTFPSIVGQTVDVPVFQAAPIAVLTDIDGEKPTPYRDLPLSIEIRRFARTLSGWKRVR